MRRSGLLVVALVALSVGCTGGDGDGGGAVSTTTEAPTTTVAETTTTTAAPDPFTVPTDPADIDEAYVEAVLTELERINGDALRLAVSEGLSPQITEMMTSIYEPELAALQLDGLVTASIGGFEGIRRPPTDVRSQVQSILAATADCISINVDLDFSGVSDDASEPSPTRVELRHQALDLPRNPTPWVFAVRQPIDVPQEAPPVCA